MSDGIVKGVGEQLGELGKQVISEVAKTPATLVGLDETLGVSKSGNSQGTSVSTTQKPEDASPSIELLKQQDEQKKQQELEKARSLIAQFSQGPVPEKTISQQQELEDLEKRKEGIKKEKLKAKMILPNTGSKPKRGNLFGIRAKQLGSEIGKNVKSE